MIDQEYLYTLKAIRLEMLTVGPTEEEQQVVSEHFAYLKTLHNQGKIILVGRTQNNDESTFGIVKFRAESEAEAIELMKSDPAVIHAVMQAMLYPFRVALMEGRDGK